MTLAMMIIITVSFLPKPVVFRSAQSLQEPTVTKGNYCDEIFVKIIIVMIILFKKLFLGYFEDNNFQDEYFQDVNF